MEDGDHMVSGVVAQLLVMVEYKNVHVNVINQNLNLVVKNVQVMRRRLSLVECLSAQVSFHYQSTSECPGLSGIMEKLMYWSNLELICCFFSFLFSAFDNTICRLLSYYIFYWSNFRG